MRKKVRQPFRYGSYLVEYREKKGDLLRILKEKLNTIEEAKKAEEELIRKGNIDIIIR